MNQNFNLYASNQKLVETRVHVKETDFRFMVNSHVLDKDSGSCAEETCRNENGK